VILPQREPVRKGGLAVRALKLNSQLYQQHDNNPVRAGIQPGKVARATPPTLIIGETAGNTIGC